MLTISDPIHSASGDIFEYYAGVALLRYYPGGFDGEWVGSACEPLGLKGKVEAEDFRKLLAGFSPRDGTPLVQNAGATRRQSAYDLTFNCDKDTSLRWALGTIRDRKLIKRALRRAVKETFPEIENTAGLSRTGKAGRTREFAKLVAAMFVHETSRANQPHLHVHLLLLNVGLRLSNGSTGSLYTKEIFRRKLAFGKKFRNNLALNLAQSGFELRHQKGELVLDGVDPRLVSAFSSRRQAILARMKELGVSGAAAAKAAALDTRSPKKSMPREQLFRAWRETALSLGWKEHSWELLPQQSHRPVRTVAVEQDLSKSQTKARSRRQSSGPTDNTESRAASAPGEAATGKSEDKRASGASKGKVHSRRRRSKREPMPRKKSSKQRFKKRRQRAHRYIDVRRYRPLGKLPVKALSKLSLPYLKTQPSKDTILTGKEKKALWTIHKRKRQLTLYEWGKSRSLENYLSAAKSVLEDDGKKIVIVTRTGTQARRLSTSTKARAYTLSSLGEKTPAPPKNTSIEKHTVFPKSPFQTIRKIGVPYVRVGPSRWEFDQHTIFMVTEAHRLHAEQVRQIIKFASAHYSKVVFLSDSLDRIREEELKNEHRLYQMQRNESANRSKDQSQSQQHSH
jgi:conjugative relaxase-like TrwC/TraI family protein